MTVTDGHRQRKIQILIAVDHLIFRAGLRKLLESEGEFVVTGEAATADETLNLVKEREPDVLLLDSLMPQVRGFEVLRRLPKSDSPLRTILLMASLENSDIVGALLLGARGIVSKQSTSEMLFKAIRCVMAGELWVSRNNVSDLVAMLRRPSPSGAAVSRHVRLTRRELEVVAAVVTGQVNRDIAQTFKISEYTVKHHLTRIFDKVGVSNRIGLAMFAISNDLIKQLEDTRLERKPLDVVRVARMG